MRRHGLRTKKEVVDLALRRLVGARPSAALPASPELIEGLECMGWDGDLDSMRDAAEPRPL